MKKLYRILVICVCVAFFNLTTSFLAFAQETNDQVEPRMENISTFSTELTISNGIASVTGSVRGKAGVTNTYVKVTLQKSESGEWVDIQSWEDSNNTRSTTIAETYPVSRGTYRVTMICSADGETKTATSAERTY